MLDRIRIGGVNLLEWVGVMTPGGKTRADIEGETGMRGQENGGAVGPTR